MTGRRFAQLPGSIGVLRHSCDLDLLLFFHRHPRAILASKQLAAYIGYDRNQLERSFDRLTEAGLIERLQNPTHAARLHVFKPPETGWLDSVLDIASTPEGRKRLIDTIREAVNDPADRIIGIGGSAGSLQPLCELLATLPPGLPATIMVVQHTNSYSQLPAVLRRITPFTVKFAERGERFRVGTVYVAPPDHHLIVNPDRTVSLSQAARIRFARPSIDRSLTTMAASFQQRGIGVILSGRLSDGARGVRAVRAAGGLTFAQMPSTCRFSDMPNAALGTGCVDAAVRPAELGSTLLAAINRIAVQHDGEWSRPFQTADTTVAD